MTGRLFAVLALALCLGHNPAQAAPYEEVDFEKRRGGNLNISAYAFHDINRNGDYDVGDLPMAGVVMQMTKPDGSIVQQNSNINGYINYKMSLNNDDQPISEPGGTYIFKVLQPPGWQITAGDQEQAIRFIAKRGSVSGLFAEKAPHWIGLAPDLAVSGRVVGIDGAALPADVQLEATGPGGERQRVDLAGNGNFRFEATPGSWSLRFSSAALDWALERTVEVNSAPVEMVTIRAGQAQPAPQPVAVLENFDWLQRSVLEKIPNGHRGLNWDYLLAVDNQEYGGPGYVNGLRSGHAGAYNSSGHPVTISAPPGQVFDFVGGYFTVAWNNANGEMLEMEAWRGDTLVARHAMKMSYLGPKWLDADLRGIDKLVLSTRHYWQFMTDDMRFRVAAP